MDLSNFGKAPELSKEEVERLSGPSGQRCVCGREMTVGEAEVVGECAVCFWAEYTQALQET